MNPFDFRGPDFLAFYIYFSSLVLLALYLTRRFGENRVSAPNISIEDPYLFACLNGGPKLAAEVCAIALLDRGLLEVYGTDSLKVSDNVPSPGKHAFEQEVFSSFCLPRRLSTFLRSASSLNYAQEYEEYLCAYDLLPDESCRRKRLVRIFVAAACLLGVSLLKIVVALIRGHSNIGFLILLTIIAIYLAFRIGHPYRTGAGDACLANVRTLFSDLKARKRGIRPGGETKELSDGQFSFCGRFQAHAPSAVRTIE